MTLTTAGISLAMALLFTQWWPLFAAIFPLASKFALFAIHVWVIHVVRDTRTRNNSAAAVRR